MKNPYRKKESKQDLACSLLTNAVELVLNDVDALELLDLNNDVDILRQSIPKIINHEKAKMLKMFADCCHYTEELLETDVREVIVPFSTMKFIKELDKITKCIKVKKK
jgi:hypothetical protein